MRCIKGGFVVMMALLTVALAGCGQEPRGAGQPEPSTPDSGVPGIALPPATDTPTEPPQVGDVVTRPSGLQFEILQEGDGPQAKRGDTVTVHYTGTFEDGEVFDSSRERGEPWTFDIGTDLAVQGFNEGVVGMRVGERRKLTLPPNIGFGALGTFADAPEGQPEDLSGSMQRGERPLIPPNTTMIFDVELLGIEEPTEP